MTIEQTRAELEKLLTEGEFPASPATDWIRTKLEELQAEGKPTGGVLRIVYGDYSEQLSEENATELRKAVADGADMYDWLDNYISDADPDYDVYLDGVQIHSTY